MGWVYKIAIENFGLNFPVILEKFGWKIPIPIMLVVVIRNIIGKVSGGNSITYYVVGKWVIAWEIVGNF
jgi:hypothetical protein